MTADCYNQNQEKSTMTFIYWNLQNLNNVIINKTKVLLSQAYVSLGYYSYPVKVFWFYCSQN